MFHSTYHNDVVQLAWVRKEAIVQGYACRKDMALARNFAVTMPEDMSLALEFVMRCYSKASGLEDSLFSVDDLT